MERMRENLRPLTIDDLDAVERIQREAYPHYHLEAIAVFADKLARYPAGCWAYETEGSVSGYLFSHPALLSNPPKLDRLLEPQVEIPDCYFIHDKAVRPSHQGQGAGRKLITTAFAHAASLGHATLALVAVQNSRPYWERYGFSAVSDLEPAVSAVRESYGPAAHYLVRRS
ncbi:MAG: GNAT family N-acetyltransferase [Planctomycetia bacterium]|nr:GNAT family N-acetyltransferase [Planctomycetia bacterium]